MDEANEIPWGVFGRDWWLEAGKSAGANDQQIKLAACRFAGLTQEVCARLAGYSSKNGTGRQRGSAAEQTKGVQMLLTLAHAELRARDLPVETKPAISPQEMDQRLDAIIRGPDQSASLRAIELKHKLKGTSVDDGSIAETGDGFSEWRIVREFLRHPGGATMVVAHWKSNFIGISNIPLLHDVVRMIERDEPEYWQIVRNRLSSFDRMNLDRCLANPEWQLEARIKLWREVGIELGDDPSGHQDKPPNPNGGQFPKSERLPA